MAVSHSFFNIMVSVIPLDKNVGCELHKEVELKAYRKIYVALRAVYYFPFIKNNPVCVYVYVCIVSCDRCPGYELSAGGAHTL